MEEKGLGVNLLREIKFRAWDKQFKKFSELPLEYKIKDLSYYIDYIWMQYTGMNDKNGKEIYEGDQVKIIYFKSHYIGEVIFNTKTCGFEIWYCSIVGLYGEKALHKMNFAADIEIEVIGNIYETPELIKED